MTTWIPPSLFCQIRREQSTISGKRCLPRSCQFLRLVKETSGQEATAWLSDTQLQSHYIPSLKPITNADCQSPMRHKMHFFPNQVRKRDALKCQNQSGKVVSREPDWENSSRFSDVVFPSLVNSKHIQTTIATLIVQQCPFVQKHIAFTLTR